MSETSETLIISESKRIEVLMQKALASDSVRGKNLYLNGLKKLLKKHSQEFTTAVGESEHL
jgi:hypothetical protein